ncbi:glycogen branching enzyme [mine drainage metagenome]|uniref:Glycogen branching enzyme n=1 Tax=mine drainage metagenome TaxID=410659 RepID=T0ZIT9_9ZZZZ
MLLTEHDIYLFREGTHGRAYEKLGAHILPADGSRQAGTHFAVWAPNAASVAVIGDFNDWNPGGAPAYAARRLIGNLGRIRRGHRARHTL